MEADWQLLVIPKNANKAGQDQDQDCIAPQLHSCEEQSPIRYEHFRGLARKLYYRCLGSIVPQPIQFREGKVAAKVANVVADV